MNKSISKGSQIKLMCWLCILGAMCLLTILPVLSNALAQNPQPASAPAKPAKLERKSDDEKREELGKKLERRRDELNSTSGSGSRNENTRQDKPRENRESGSKEVKTKSNSR